MDFLATPHLWLCYEMEQAAGDRAATSGDGRTDLSRWQLVLWGKLAALSGGGAIALLLTATQLQATGYPGRGTAYIAPPAGYNVNIRTGPSTAYPAVNTLRPGTPITLTGRYEGGWAELADHTWVAGNLIQGAGATGQPGNPGVGDRPQPGIPSTAYIAPPPGYNLNIRRGPGVNFPAVNTLARGTAITLTGTFVNGWAELTDGSWVAGNWIQAGPPINIAVRPTPQPISPSQGDVLQLGSRGPSVQEVERRLLQLGYFTANFVPDDYFGPDTQQAVRNFQQLNRLPIDGMVGPQTRQVLFSAGAIDNFPDNSGGDISNPNPQPPPIVDPNPPNPGSMGTFQIQTDDGQSALVFSGPGTEYDLLGFLDNGTQVQTTGRTEGNWSELQDQGWVYTDWLAPL